MSHPIRDEYGRLSWTDTCLAYRYLYYVTANSPISDFQYDLVEKRAIKEQQEYPEHSVHKVGSSLPSSYPQYIIDEANREIIYQKEKHDYYLSRTKRAT